MDESWKSPRGEGLAVWADLRSGDLLAEAASSEPEAGLRVATEALAMRNVVARRNATRVLARLGTGAAGGKVKSMTLGLLGKTRLDSRPLIAHEGTAALRKIESKAAFDPMEPYLKGDESEEGMIAYRVSWFGQSARNDEVEGEEFRNDPFGRIAYGPLETGDAKRLLGPRGDVLDSLVKSAREAHDKEARAKAFRLLAVLEDPRGIPAARTGLADRANEVRQAAALASGCMGDEFVLGPAVDSLMRKGPLRWDAAHAIGALGDIRGCDPLWTAYVRGVHTDCTLRTLVDMGELWEAYPPKLAAQPKLLIRHWGQASLAFHLGSRVGEEFLRFLRLAPDESARRVILRSVDPDHTQGGDRRYQRAIAEKLTESLMRRIQDTGEAVATRTDCVRWLSVLCLDGDVRDELRRLQTLVGKESEILEPMRKRVAKLDGGAKHGGA